LEWLFAKKIKTAKKGILKLYVTETKERFDGEKKSPVPCGGKTQQNSREKFAGNRVFSGIRQRGKRHERI